MLCIAKKKENLIYVVVLTYPISKLQAAMSFYL